MEEITGFEGKYSFLSNFYKHTVVYLDEEFPTAEHAYQWSKTLDKMQRKAILKARSPGMAKKVGQDVILRKNWDGKKLGIMEAIVFNKFSQSVYLVHELRETESIHLIEGNYWHDNYWGECTCKKCVDIPASNHLGNILMTIRAKLRYCM